MKKITSFSLVVLISCELLAPPAYSNPLLIRGALSVAHLVAGYVFGKAMDGIFDPYTGRQKDYGLLVDRLSGLEQAVDSQLRGPISDLLQKITRETTEQEYRRLAQNTIESLQRLEERLGITEAEVRMLKTRIDRIEIESKDEIRKLWERLDQQETEINRQSETIRKLERDKSSLSRPTVTTVQSAPTTYYQSPPTRYVQSAPTTYYQSPPPRYVQPVRTNRYQSPPPRYVQPVRTNRYQSPPPRYVQPVRTNRYQSPPSRYR